MSQFNFREEDCKKTITDCHLVEISRKCSGDWTFLPSQLGLGDFDVDSEPGDEEGKRREFFMEWKQREDRFGVTYEQLICALLKCEQQLDAEKVCELLQESLQGSNPPLQGSPKLGKLSFGSIDCSYTVILS